MTEAIVDGAASTPTSGAATTTAATAAAAGTAAAAAAPAAATAAAATQPAANGQTAAAATSAPAAGTSGDGTAVKAAVPEKYEFTAPKGAVLDAPTVAAFSTVAKELGLTQEAAQKVVDQLVPTLAQRATEVQTEALKAAVTRWVGEVQADPEIGGDKMVDSVAAANKAIAAFGTPALRALLDASGLGNNPEFVRVFSKIGKAISEDKFVIGGRQPLKGTNDPASALYPNQQPTS